MRVPDDSPGAVESVRIWHYAAAVLAVVVAAVVRLALDPVLGSGHELFFFCLAVMVAVRLGGLGPGMLAALVSGLAAWYFFFEPKFSLQIADSRDWWTLLALVGTGVGITLLGSRRPAPVRPRQDSGGFAFYRRALLFSASLLLLAALTFILNADLRRENDRRRWFAHSYEVLRGTGAVLANLEDAETGQRGYLLTGEERYLEPFESAVRQEHSVRQTLRRLMADEAGQKSNLDRLDALATAKFSELQQTIDLRRTRGLAPALAIVRSGDGKRTMDQFRVLLAAMAAEDRALVTSRSRDADAAAMRMRWELGLGSGSLLLLLVVAGVVIERDTRNRERDRQAISRSAERLRLALDTAGAGTWEWDPATNENVWSEELWKLYGLEPHSVTPSYEAWRDAVHPDDRPRAEEVVARAARNGTELTVEFRVRGAGPTTRWLLSRGGPLADERGLPARFVGIVLDITPRKLAEEALRAREQDLRHFAEFAPVAIAMFDREMRYLAVSRRFREDYGLTGEVAGCSHYDVFPEMPEPWREIHRRCLAGAVERHPGERFVRSDGTEQWVRWEIQPWYQAGGTIGGIILFSEDITAARRSEDALRQVSEQRRMALEAARLGAWDYRFHKQEVFWDDTCKEMFGISADGPTSYEEAISRVHPEDRPATEAAVNRALAGVDEGAFRHDFRIVRPDGSIHWITSHGRVRFAETGGCSPAVAFTGVNMDITQRKEAELEIRQLNSQLEQRVRQRTIQLELANQELEAFAYSVSHDLRAPLRGIDGWSLALAEDYDSQLDVRGRRYIDRVRSETQRMGLLIDDLLQLSRVGRAEMQFLPVDLTAAAESIAAELREAHEARAIEFAIEPGLNSRGDARLLGIALTNLLSNAVKFTAPRERARIEFGRSRNGQPGFYVRDNGVGFDMAYCDKLFRPFQRLHRASEFPGTGIGLATVQRVIHRHMGKVWAESGIDQGATFYFTIGETQ
ncbi:MAG TPA: CHASE3 domain-containing protein [Bryobacteraceae bacterium]|nr:CHASE3 domain-containing protein [Bryobacteraceae bacterium]